MSSIPSANAAASADTTNTATPAEEESDADTLCPSSNEEEDDGVNNNDDEEAPNPMASLRSRIPSSQSVLDEILNDKETAINMALDYSYLYNRENGGKERAVLLDPELWKKVNEKLCTALSVCAATVDKDVKKMTTKYLQECIEIDTFAAGMHQDDHFTSILGDNKAHLHTSCLLQMICMEYIDIFHQLITYPSKGEALSINEQVKAKVDHALKVGTNELYPNQKVKDNVYYIIGFLGNQAEKHAERCAEGSGGKKCIEYIVKNRFHVNNRGEENENQIKALLDDAGVPTALVQQRERLGGLHYADKACWEFFAIIDYLYATIATAENFICRGGRLLSELSCAIQENTALRQQFSSLCDFVDDDKSDYTFDDTTTTFGFFLRVFGRVRAKDIALKFNSALYKGKNTVALRSGLAAMSGNKKKSGRKRKRTKKEDKPQDEDEDTIPHEEEECKSEEEEEEENEEEVEKNNHQEILNDLEQFNAEMVDDGSSKKVSSDAASAMIENDASEE